VAGFLGLSLLYLWRREWRRSSGRALGGVAAFAIVILATLGAAQRWWNLPLAAFTTSHAAGNGGHYDQVLARPTLSHFATQLRLLTWLCPAWVVLVVLAVRGRLPRTPRTRHLAAASAGMLLFFFSWFPALGADDWNLFANAAIPLSLLTWTGIFTCLPRLPYHSPSC